MRAILVRLTIMVISILLVATFVASCGPPVPWGSPLDWGWSSFVWLPLYLFGIGLYFLPIIVAAVRRRKNMLGIVLLNILAGWTVIGWIISLVWSLTGDTQSQEGNR